MAGARGYALDGWAVTGSGAGYPVVRGRAVSNGVYSTFRTEILPPGSLPRLATRLQTTFALMPP